MKKLFTSFMLLLASQVHAIDVLQNQALEKLFIEAGVNGTFVLYDVSAIQMTVHDQHRAEKRFIPASTFKIARLAQGKLPFSTEVQQSVREIVQLEQGDGWVLYGKTGWATTPEPDLGWWVGWVAKDQRVYSFAINIDMPDKADVAKRVELGKACLRVLGIF